MATKYLAAEKNISMYSPTQSYQIGDWGERDQSVENDRKIKIRIFPVAPVNTEAANIVQYDSRTTLLNDSISTTSQNVAGLSRLHAVFKEAFTNKLQAHALKRLYKVFDEKTNTTMAVTLDFYRQDLPDWIKEAYELAGEENSVKSVMPIMRAISSYLQKAEFEDCDEVATKINYSKLNSVQLTAFLRLCSPHKDKLENWDNALSNASKILNERGLDPKIILRGIL